MSRTGRIIKVAAGPVVRILSEVTTPVMGEPGSWAPEGVLRGTKLHGSPDSRRIAQSESRSDQPPRLWRPADAIEGARVSDPNSPIAPTASRALRMAVASS